MSPFSIGVFTAISSHVEPSLRPPRIISLRSTTRCFAAAFPAASAAALALGVSTLVDLSFQRCHAVSAVHPRSRPIAFHEGRPAFGSQYHVEQLRFLVCRSRFRPVRSTQHRRPAVWTLPAADAASCSAAHWPAATLQRRRASARMTLPQARISWRGGGKIARDKLGHKRRVALLRAARIGTDTNTHKHTG